MTGVLAPGARLGVRRILGAVVAVIGVVIPALPLGPLVAQPPFPLVALWAAYGWASEAPSTWRTPLFLFALGVLHDQMAGGPYGVFAALYAFAFFVALFANRMMSAPNLLAVWGGFAATCAATSVLAAFIALAAYGRNASALAFMETAAITALLFPLARPLYMPSAIGPQRAGAAEWR